MRRKQKSKRSNKKVKDLQHEQNLQTVQNLKAAATAAIKMDIQTTVKGGHVKVNIRTSDDKTILTATDNDSQTKGLASGVDYRFEWFVTTSEESHVKIEASVFPPNEEFPPLKIEKDYPAGSSDGGAFIFTLN